jgi:hypothetical protein
MQLEHPHPEPRDFRARLADLRSATSQSTHAHLAAAHELLDGAAVTSEAATRERSLRHARGIYDRVGHLLPRLALDSADLQHATRELARLELRLRAAGAPV